MKVIITRIKNIDNGTIGKFSVIYKGNVVLNGYTLEPSGPDTVEPMKDKRIPQGEYNMDWYFSKRFSRLLPRLSNPKVSKSRFIAIHAGNNHLHTEGCILLGDRYDNNGVYNSRITVNKFVELLKNKEIKVEIINENV